MIYCVNNFVFPHTVHVTQVWLGEHCRTLMTVTDSFPSDSLNLDPRILSCSAGTARSMRKSTMYSRHLEHSIN